ncbi:hypothetical protein [Pleionea litopenaei]|uniref:Uncharacterized protein n=1 Tax=Pleionea litopenaei TaxID=3070815 RepID=A0AA51RUH7_9GAMM|nr:hypothetical protein [Pleionea sp. HL-JVS1]WMS87810.1 hypothetical protein Q9312_02520 [Pleionea sp. HL-JVS1]
MFDKKSRYRNSEIYKVTDSRGRLVDVVCAVDKPIQSFLGYHRRKQGQRLDHLAFRYMKDATGFWRLAEFNQAMMAEQLSEVQEIAVPAERN